MVPVHHDGAGMGGTLLLAVDACDETVDVMLYQKTECKVGTRVQV